MARRRREGKSAEDVAAGRRIPLPNCGQVRSAVGGDWRPVAGEGHAIVVPRRAPAERKAKGVGFDPFRRAQIEQEGAW
jgi:hypothetical protein